MNQLKSRWESGPAGSKPTLQTAESPPQTASEGGFDSFS